MSRILAVDDDNSILEVLQYILEDSGYEVEVLNDGRKVLERVEASTPDLILLDIMLGGVDGRELCSTIKSREDTHKIPVIMISASHDLRDLPQRHCAPNDFIAKPFDINVLLNKIQRQLAA